MFPLYSSDASQAKCNLKQLDGIFFFLENCDVMVSNRWDVRVRLLYGQFRDS